MINALLVATILATDGGTPPITREDVMEHRKTSFLKTVQKMESQLPPGFICTSTFHDEMELAFWHCLFTPNGKHLGSLWIWQNGTWAQVPGIFAD
jgi:hypothetical protein